MKVYLTIPAAEELSAKAGRFGEGPEVHAVRLFADYFHTDLVDIDEQPPMIWHSRRAELNLVLPDELYEVLCEEANEFGKTPAGYAATAVLADRLGFRDEGRYDEFFSEYFSSTAEAEEFLNDWDD